MDVIKLQNFKGSDFCYFLDAGDIEIIPVYQWHNVVVKRKSGPPLFETVMNPEYVIAFGSISGYPLDRESFELPVGKETENILKEDVFCFDPRVVASVIFMNMLRHKVFKNGKQISDIALPMLSTEESKEFLRKNNLLWEGPDPDWTPNPPEELIGIPEKVKKLLE